jgi:hypothetical protein
MVFIACSRAADVENPPSAEDMSRRQVESDDRDHRKEHFEPQVSLLGRPNGILEVIADRGGYAVEEGHDIYDVALPDPLDLGIKPEPPFQFLGVVQAPDVRPWDEGYRPFYRGAQLWRIAPANLDAAIGKAERETERLREAARLRLEGMVDSFVARDQWPHLPLEKAIRAFETPVGSVVRRDPFYEYYVASDLWRPEPADSPLSAFAFWREISACIRLSRKDLDLIVMIPPGRRGAETRRVAYDRIERAIRENDKDFWESRFRERATSWAEYVRGLTDRQIACPVHRFELVSEYRRMPRIHLNKGIDLSTLHYLLRDARVEWTSKENVPGGRGYLLTADAVQSKRLVDAIERAKRGEWDMALLEEADLTQFLERDGREGVESLFEDVGDDLLRVASRVVKGPGLVLGQGECNVDHEVEYLNERARAQQAKAAPGGRGSQT